MWADQVAARLGVDVVVEVPRSGAWGEYDATENQVRIHPLLSGVQLRCVLAHELGHAAHRHTSSTPLTEREADEFAHWLLIPLCGFLRAASAYESAQAVAHELGVLPSFVEGFAGRL